MFKKIGNLQRLAMELDTSKAAYQNRGINGGEREKEMKRFDLSKIMFYIVLTAAALGGSFYFGLYSAAENTKVYQEINALKEKIFSSSELVAEESATLTKIHPDHFVQPSRYEGEGVTINAAEANQDDLILMAGFFKDDNQLRLIRRDGSLVAKWPVRFYDIFESNKHIREPPATNWNADTHGSLILPDGSVVFNFEYCGLVKLDRCGNLVWRLERETHHSVERAEKGGYWVPGRRYHSKETQTPFPPFDTPFKEDTILHVSEDGKVLKEISVPEIFYKNRMESLITASGHWYDLNFGWDREILHLNKIVELSSDLAADFPMFKAGDLALSIRESNLVMVIDPATQKIKWWRIGPWLRQHDPEFNAGGTISIFNNNCYRTAYGYSGKDRSPLDAPRISNIMKINPATDEFQVIYGDKTGQEMLSIIRGKHDPTAVGGLFITEFEGGRVFETDQEGNIIWEYINRYSRDEVAEISEARVYPKSYFTVADWADCKKGDKK